MVIGAAACPCPGGRIGIIHSIHLCTIGLNILTYSLYRMEIQRCRMEGIDHVGFIDPYHVNPTIMQSGPKGTEDYALKCILELQSKKYILLPYHFGYVFPSMNVLLFLINTTLEIRIN